MATISKIQVGSTTYDIMDATARSSISNIKGTVDMRGISCPTAYLRAAVSGAKGDSAKTLTCVGSAPNDFNWKVLGAMQPMQSHTTAGQITGMAPNATYHVEKGGGFYSKYAMNIYVSAYAGTGGATNTGSGAATSGATCKMVGGRDATESVTFTTT